MAQPTKTVLGKRSFFDSFKSVFSFFQTDSKKGSDFVSIKRKPDVTISCNYSNNEISDLEWKKIETRCYAGQYSESGFLGKDEKLREVIESDARYLEDVGITHKQISGKLEELITEFQEQKKKRDMIIGPGLARPGRSENSILVDIFKISCIQYRGFQKCPFENKDFERDEKCRGSCDYTITNIDTNDSIKFGDLLIHLIERHQFFEGYVEYRIDPEKIIRVLGIKTLKPESSRD